MPFQHLSRGQAVPLQMQRHLWTPLNRSLSQRVRSFGPLSCSTLCSSTTTPQAYVPPHPSPHSFTLPITSIFLPARPERASDAYLRFIPRTEMDIAVSSAAVSLELDGDGVVTAAHVAIGAVAPTMLLVKNAGAALVGSKLEETAIAGLVAAVEAACNPITDKRGTIEFRTRTAGVLAKRAAHIANSRAGGQA